MTDADALAPVGAATHLPADLLPDPALVGPRCLVTGGSGYLGRALVARLLDAGCEVSTLDLTDEGPDSRVRHVTGDLRDYDAIAPAFEGVTTVFHSAALIATVEERFAQPALRRRAYGVNVVGTENVLRAARASGVRALVHISSFNVVMDHAIEGGDESLPYATNAPDLYSRTKIAAERAVLAADGASTALASGAPAADAFLRTVALRPGGIWGPGRGGMMLDAMVAELAKGTFKATIGDGHTPLDNTHVENVVDAAVLAARGLHERPACGRARLLHHRRGALRRHGVVPPPGGGTGAPVPAPACARRADAAGRDRARARAPTGRARAHHHAPLHPEPDRRRPLLDRPRRP
ncbi:MAG: NAD-dependent epimerase/dehydratase family protein [Polyangiales bacterium]